ncbi:MAG: SDR family oxidoreductase [Nostoc sp.]|uniref:SDR family NAD(P)-dependent oxidoreductase n=1 Tax=Nostoc sp. TaxID=1180 RepID=UPI002FF0AFAF
MIDLTGKVVLITGAARGIGEASARAVVAAGGYVVANDVLAEQLDVLQADLGSERCHVVVSDLADVTAVPYLWERATDWRDGIDVLVNNAGVYEKALIEGDFEDWHTSWIRTLNINLVAPASLCREAIHHFKQQGGGKIINIASRAGFRGDLPDYTHYAASKGGMLALSRTIARGFADKNILVYAIAPGFVRTELNAEYFDSYGESAAISQTPLGEMAMPQDIANVVIFLASDLARHVTGATIDVNGASYVR